MIWKNRKLSFILALPLALVFASLLFSSSSYATSQSYSCSTLSCYNQQIKLTHTDSSVGFSFSYVSIEVQADKSLTNFNAGSFYNNTSKFILINSSGYAFDLFSVTDSYFKLSANWAAWMSNDTLPFTFTITFYDSFPIVPCECPDCPVPDPCPEIPENPYDDKLDNINKSILICGAIMIFIYFMFCIYQCFFGGLKK